jgi:hypothetical protein
MPNNKLIAKTATEGLKILWSEKFFEKYRTMADIVENFSKRHHHFTDAELGMALKRASYLTRKGKKFSYEYIQKHPYAEEKEDAKRNRIK